ncbi:MAG: hypothetical protein ACI83B_000691 [Sediminicola sp.]|jgi:hypothetical protein
MKKTKFTESLIIKALKSCYAGKDVTELCCELDAHWSGLHSKIGRSL